MRGTSHGGSSRPPVGLPKLGLLLSVCIVLGALAWWLQRATGERTRVLVQAAPRALESAAPDAGALRAPPEGAATGTDAGAEASPEPVRTATVVPAAALEGHLTIDGRPSFGATLRVSSANGAWQREVPLDEEGGFRLDRLPPARLVLAFACESGTTRRLLLPTLDLHPEAEAVERLALDWTTTQVNLRIAGDEAAAFTRVEIEGPGYHTSVEANEHGRALLSLVGEGPFTFRMTGADGRAREARLALEPDQDLVTVFLSAEG